MRVMPMMIKTTKIMTVVRKMMMTIVIIKIIVVGMWMMIVGGPACDACDVVMLQMLSMACGAWSVLRDVRYFVCIVLSALWCAVYRA